jgi:imidazolonepropionase-like amidohydrolase
VLLGAAALANAGIDVAFRGGFPESASEALRLTASLAVRHGMDPGAARRAMTSAPAAVAGVADRIGAIAPSKDADIVVFSDDPLRMDAKVLEVYVQGVRVYVAP